MADNELKIKISADTKSANEALAGTRSELEGLGGISLATKNRIDLLAHSAQLLGGIVAPLVRGIASFADTTIKLNSDLQNLQGRLTGLIAANSANVTSTGRAIDAAQKWAMSNIAAGDALSELKNMASATNQPVGDLADGFSMFYATASDQGSISQALKAFDSIAAAAKVAGKNIGDLVPMFDSLATGTVVAGSEMGSFMRIVGLSNEELKKANANGEVFDLLNQKLAKFKELNTLSAGSYQSALSGFKNELSSLQQELGKPIFDSFNSALSSAAVFLKQNHDLILNLGGALLTGAKHIGIFAAALLSAKAATAAFNGAASLSKSALSGLSVAFSGATSATVAFRTALTTLKLAFKTFLPTAIVFSGLELLISYLNKASAASDKLAASAARTTAQLRAMSSAQRQNEINELNKARNDLLDEKAKYEVRAKRGDIFTETADFWLGGASERRTANQAKADEADQKLKQIDEQINRLRRIEAGTYKEAEEALVSSATKQTEDLAADNKKLARNLKNRNNYLVSYYEQKKQIGDAWAIKESELRGELKEAGFSDAQIEDMVETNKQTYLSRFEQKLSKASVTGPKISAPKDAAKDYKAALDRAIEYYEAIGDAAGKAAKEREKQTTKLRELGLSAAQIEAYYAKKAVEQSRSEHIKNLEFMERYYELLGEKAKAANAKLQGEALRMQQEGYSQSQIANSLYGENTKKANYNSLYQGTGYDTGIMGEFSSRLEAIDTFYETEKARIAAHYDAIEGIQSNSLARQAENDRASMQARMSYAGAGFDALGSIAKQFYDASNGENKTALRAYQAMMVGKAIVNTYTAASNAYASAGNPYLGAALAAVAIAQGMAQVAMIKAQKFHTGGAVGLARDEVPAILQTGEYVLSRKEVAALKQDDANSTRGEGGVVIINSLDNSVLEQWANSRNGRRVIKNIISAS